ERVAEAPGKAEPVFAESSSLGIIDDPCGKGVFFGKEFGERPAVGNEVGVRPVGSLKGGNQSGHRNADTPERTARYRDLLQEAVQLREKILHIGRRIFKGLPEIMLEKDLVAEVHHHKTGFVAVDVQK